MKVLLVIPNFRWVNSDPNTLWHYIPYNLCLLAACVRDLCQVEILDANKLNLSQSEFSAEVKRRNPDLVGITLMMDEYGKCAHDAASLVKKVCRVPVVVGGVYATTNPEQVIQDENIDYVVIGEGEYIFRNLLLFILGIKDQPPTEGLCYWVKGAVFNGGHAGMIEDLDVLPLPDYTLIDLPSYATKAERRSVDGPPAYPYARMFTSRGCPFHCVFCQVEKIQGRKFRGRSAENVLNEMEWLKRTYGIKGLIFDDDNMLFNRKRAVEIFQGMIDLKLNLKWVMIATAVFELDHELLQLMRDSGCCYIDVAVETGCERIMRDVIGKPVKLDQARLMIAYARIKGIFVTANFILGFPTETWEEIRETIRVAEDIGADYLKIFTAIPLRNTRLWDLCLETHSFKEGFDPDKTKWSTGQIQTDEFTPNDLSILRAYEWDRLNFSTPEKRNRICEAMGITHQELNQIRKATRANVLNILQK